MPPRISMPAKARIPAREKVVASPAITVAKAKIPAKGRAAARPTVPRSNNSESGRARKGSTLTFTAMPANRFNAFTDYGIGIGLRIPHYQHIFEKKPVVDWFEIISEKYMVDGGRPLAVLEEILGRYLVVQPGG